MQKIVVLVAMLLLMLALAVPALATGNNQNAQSFVAVGSSSGGSEQVVFSDGSFSDSSSGVIVNDVRQTSTSGDITSSRVVAD